MTWVVEELPGVAQSVIFLPSGDEHLADQLWNPSSVSNTMIETNDKALHQSNVEQ